MVVVLNVLVGAHNINSRSTTTSHSRSGSLRNNCFDTKDE